MNKYYPATMITVILVLIFAISGLLLLSIFIATYFPAMILQVLNIIVLSVLVVITWMYVKTTEKILDESKRQGIQDAELKTAPTQVVPRLTDKKNTIEMDIRGGRPILSRIFTIIDTRGKKMESEGTSPRRGIFKVDLSQLFLGSIVGKYKLYITIKFKSFLGHDWIYKMESADLINELGGKILRPGKHPHVGPDFRLIEVIPPWE